MWIQHSNGNVVSVSNPDHITRLLSDGGHEVPDPTIPISIEAKESEQPDGSTSVNGVAHRKRPKNDSRPRRRKPAVSG